jgi:threonine/homoserine/homoserine lactone efflux protein
VASFVLIAIPGPSVLFVIGRALSLGRGPAIARVAGNAAALDAQVPQLSRWRVARQGFVVGVANPKALIIFGAVLPQFVNRAAGYVPGQMLLLSLVSFGIALISDSLWAVTAGTVRSWFAGDPRRLAAVGGAGGLAMIGVG